MLLAQEIPAAAKLAHQSISASHLFILFLHTASVSRVELWRNGQLLQSGSNTGQVLYHYRVCRLNLIRKNATGLNRPESGQTRRRITPLFLAAQPAKSERVVGQSPAAVPTSLSNKMRSVLRFGR